VSSRWRALVRPSLLRAIACGVAMAIATLPVALFLGGLARGSGATAGALLDRLAFLMGLALATGTLGALPAAWLERQGRDASTRRVLLVSLACGALVAAAGLVLVAQASYVEGVLRGGVDGGMNELGRMLDSVRRKPARALSLAGGTTASLLMCVTLVVVMRLRSVATGWQPLAGVALAGLSTLVLGCLSAGVFLAALNAKERDVDRLLDVSPVLGTVALGALMTALILAVYGLPLLAVLPLALRLSDRLGGRLEPPAPEPEPAP
jgi:hypothetical protein